MRAPIARRAPIATAALAAIALMGPAEAPAARGGLSITPGIFEAPARPGALGALRVSNTTARALKVRLAVRPWLQSRSGSVTPNRQRTLAKVRPSRGAFRLPAGGARAVNLRLTRLPKRRALYGAIEVTGAPIRRGGEGVRVAYRLVSSLRLNPPRSARRLGARAKRLFVKGTARRGALFLALKSTGNTILPVGATVAIRGRGRVLRNEIVPKTILPGQTVNLRLTRLRGTLPRGRYSVAVRLTQGGRGIGRARWRGVRLR